MTYQLRPLLLIPFLSLCLLACGSESDGGGSSTAVGSLSEECASYCDAQLAAGCRESLPLARCQSSCESIGERFCEAEWNALNHCMSNATLFCNAQGQPAVGQECFDLVDAYGACLER